MAATNRRHPFGIPEQPPSRGLLGGVAFGGLLRGKLYPGEAEFFQQNPNVAGMASDDNRVVLNPLLSDPAAQKSVFMNEAARLYMRQFGTPDFALTPEQQTGLLGTHYETAPPEAQRATVLARAIAGDPSAGNVTPEQLTLAKALLGRMFKWRPE